MIVGTGIDIVDIERITAICSRQASFAARILTPEEHAYASALTQGRQIEYIAGRFAAKEAVSKAIGTGIGSKLSFQDIKVINNEKGKPSLVISPHALAQLFPSELSLFFHVSISHSKSYALAQVIIEQA